MLLSVVYHDDDDDDDDDGTFKIVESAERDDTRYLVQILPK